MGKSKSKIRRYSNLFKVVENWPKYLWKKSIGFDDFFEFNIKDFGGIRVHKQALGPFRENFLDQIYLSRLPSKLFEKEKMTVLDIGANIGYFSLFFLSKYPKSTMYAFEPHPYSFQRLQEYKNEFNQFDLSIFQLAIGGNNENLRLNASTLDGFNTMSSVFENEESPHQFEVKSRTLESFVNEKGIEEIDLIKLDCEGSEYAILYSAPSKL